MCALSSICFQFVYIEYFLNVISQELFEVQEGF